MPSILEFKKKKQTKKKHSIHHLSEEQSLTCRLMPNHSKNSDVHISTRLHVYAVLRYWQLVLHQK